MVRGGGFWKRPVTRMYSYNLDLGEHYYYPISNYLDAERGSRGETPGALTYSERLARRWLHGRRYESGEMRDRYSRASSMSRPECVPTDLTGLGIAIEARNARARSVGFGGDENNVSAFSNYKNALLSTSAALRQEAQASQLAREQAKASSTRMHAAAAKKQVQFQQAERAERAERAAMESMMQQQQETTRSTMRMTESKQRISDDICKKVADIHMLPWSAGQELEEAQSASARARGRIADLERELEEITKKAMSSTSIARMTAAQMAKQASLEDEQAMSSSYRKSKQVMVQSSSKVSK